MVATKRRCYRCMSETNSGVCERCGFDMEKYQAPLHHLKQGTILNGKYMIGVAIGEGGFGITYIGYDLNLGIKVAVKEYFPNGLVSRDTHNTDQITIFSGSDQQQYNAGKEKFINEARALAKFDNLPGVVSVKDFFKENGTAYIVMEFIEGETFRNYLRRNGNRISAEQTINMMRPVIESLIYIHRSGIIHRDISPDNIMITRDGRVKLIDFGAARNVTGARILPQHERAIMIGMSVFADRRIRTMDDLHAMLFGGGGTVPTRPPMPQPPTPDPGPMPGPQPTPAPQSSKAPIVILISALGAVAVILIIVLLLVMNNSGSGGKKPSNDDIITTTTAAPTAAPTPAPAPKFETVSASSTRGVDYTAGYANYYYASYACDGDFATAWSCNRDVELTPTITLSSASKQHVNGVKIANGYFKSEQTYTRNRRITKVMVSYDGGSKTVELSKNSYRVMQDIPLDNPVDTSYISIKVLETVYGDWKDVSISEISVY